MNERCQRPAGCTIKQLSPFRVWACLHGLAYSTERRLVLGLQIGVTNIAKNRASAPEY